MLCVVSCFNVCRVVALHQLISCCVVLFHLQRVFCCVVEFSCITSHCFTSRRLMVNISHRFGSFCLVFVVVLLLIDSFVLFRVLMRLRLISHHGRRPFRPRSPSVWRRRWRSRRASSWWKLLPGVMLLPSCVFVVLQEHRWENAITS